MPAMRRRHPFARRAPWVTVPAILLSAGSACGAGQPLPSIDWPTSAGDSAGTYHSSLTDINVDTVSRLGFDWDYELHTHRCQEATPLVLGGVLYGVGNFGRVYAVDAASGAERWTYDPGANGQWGRYACCDAVNRGLAAANGMIFVAALDGYLHAVDAASGRLIWKVDTLPARGPRTPYTSTGGPVVAGNLILIGSGGGDFKGVRGYVAAFDARTGALRWRFYTVPRDPAQGPQDQPALSAALDTWDPHHPWETGAGGAVWDGIAFDAALGLVYVGTGNASPYNIKANGRSGGDDLYTDSIIAVHADSGTLAWHYQVVPGDMWDFDSTQKLIFAELDFGTGTRPVLMQASKNGFFYVLDRRDGTFISAHPFAFQNWCKSIDGKTGRPVLSAAVDYNVSPKLIFPWEGGAHSWQPMSFDGRSQQVFIPVQESPNVIVDTARRRAGLVEGQFTSTAFPPEAYDPGELAALYGRLPDMKTLAKGLPVAPRHGFLRAWDPIHQRQTWQVPTASGWDGGVLSTDGGLVFQGDVTGALNVYAATSGKLLRRIALGTSIMAAPMTYRWAGIQYIAVMAGYGGSEMGSPFPQRSAAYRYGNESRIIALRLDGAVPPLPAEVRYDPMPQPPPATGTSTQIASGELLYNRYCARCHVFGHGLLPDLRRLSPAKHAIFPQIVLQGVLSGNGMGRFDDVLTPADVDALHAYLIDQAWTAFRDSSREP